MSTEWIKGKDPQANSAVCALWQRIYRTSSKKMARDHNKPRGLTHLQDDGEQQNASRDFLEQLWFHSMSS